MESRGALLGLEWIPRTVNWEADALADGRTEGFDPGLRVEADPNKFPWLVLNRLFEEGTKFYEVAQTVRRPSMREVAVENRHGKKRAKLKEREPW